MRLNAEVVRVQRSQEGVTVHVDFAGDEQWLNKPREAKLQFDWLVLCCPLQSISEWLDLTPEEKGLAAALDLDVEEHGAVFSDNVWPYFPHVSAADIAAGWYDRIESLQGTNRTWYNGGIMCFELIEPIIEYLAVGARRSNDCAA